MSDDGTIDHPDRDDDPPADEAERREAEALRVALERGRAEAELPEDALQTAALLRHGADGSALSAERLEALLPDVLEAAERAQARRPAPARRAPFWRWLLGLGGVAAAVAVALLIVLLPRGPVAPTALPAPSPALLEAQLARAAGDPAGDEAAFEAAMDDYRGAVLGALRARYGAR